MKFPKPLPSSPSYFSCWIRANVALNNGKKPNDITPSKL